MIPALESCSSSKVLLLPAGVHPATLAEIASVFATNDKRLWLFEGLLRAVDVLRGAGCRRIYLGGSYTTSKLEPGDYDGCWDPTGVRPNELDQSFIYMPLSRPIQKQRYRGELWQGRHDLPGLNAMTTFFQTDTRTGVRKGLLEIGI